LIGELALLCDHATAARHFDRAEIMVDQIPLDLVPFRTRLTASRAQLGHA
jgi:hypothetical protein